MVGLNVGLPNWATRFQRRQNLVQLNIATQHEFNTTSLLQVKVSHSANIILRRENLIAHHANKYQARPVFCVLRLSSELKMKVVRGIFAGQLAA